MIGTEVHGHKGDKTLMEKQQVITVGSAVSLSGDGNTVAIGATGNDANGSQCWTCKDL